MKTKKTKKTTKPHRTKTVLFKEPALRFALGQGFERQGSGRWDQSHVTKGSLASLDEHTALVCPKGHVSFNVHFSRKRNLLMFLCTSCGGHNEGEVAL